MIEKTLIRRFAAGLGAKKRFRGDIKVENYCSWHLSL